MDEPGDLHYEFLRRLLKVTWREQLERVRLTLLDMLEETMETFSPVKSDQWWRSLCRHNTSSAKDRNCLSLGNMKLTMDSYR